MIFVSFTDLVQIGLLTNPLIEIELILNYYDISQFGIWVIDVVYSWNGPSTLTRQFTIDYVPPANPCFLAIAPPLTIASYTNNLSDLDFLVDVNVSFDPTYPTCLYDVSLVVTKDVQPDTRSNVISFAPMVGASLPEVG
jgi:hypothetical protein